MSKILDASCQALIVTVDGEPVPTAVIQSQGIKSSTGLLFMDGEKHTYVTSNASDISDLISDISDLIQLISDTFTAIGTGMTGPTTAPPATLPASITQLALIKTALNLMKENLK